MVSGLRPLPAGLAVFSLAGRTAFVSGSSRGIGLAIARGLAGAGARTILGARSGDVLAARVAEIRQAGGDADYVVFDAMNHDSVVRTVASLPPVDILVNVQGTNIRKPLLEYSDAEYDYLMGLNLHSVVDVTRQVGARMIERGAGGRILMIASLIVRIGVPNVAVYTATKGALAALTMALAAEWAPYGIQTNAIIPGMILTDLNKAMWEPPEMHAWLRNVQANPRLGRPEDVAPLAVYLASPAADYVTGQLIAVDGGYTTTKMWPFSGDPSTAAADEKRDKESRP